MEKTQVLIKTIEKMAQFMRDYSSAEMPETLMNFSFMQIRTQTPKAIELLTILLIRYWRKINYVESLCYL